MSKRDQAIRFTVGTPDKHAGVWRVWINPNKSDVYIAERSIADQFKISLHESGDWRQAFTVQHIPQLREGQTRVIILPGDSAEIPSGPTTISNRVVSAWERPQDTVPGLIAAFAIVVPHSELRALEQALSEKDRQKIVFVKPSSTKEATEFTIILATPGQSQVDWPSSDRVGSPIQLIGHAHLANGETVWVFAHGINLNPGIRAHIDGMKGFGFETAGEDVSSFELRGWVALKKANGFRWILDVALTE